MSGRAFKYFTQPMRSDFNLRGDQSHRHPERSEAKPKDPAKLAVTFATGFLGFARNDNRAYAQASSAGAETGFVAEGR